MQWNQLIYIHTYVTIYYIRVCLRNACDMHQNVVSAYSCNTHLLCLLCTIWNVFHSPEILQKTPCTFGLFGMKPSPGFTCATRASGVTGWREPQRRGQWIVGHSHATRAAKLFALAGGIGQVRINVAPEGLVPKFHLDQYGATSSMEMHSACLSLGKQTQERLHKNGGRTSLFPGHSNPDPTVAFGSGPIRQLHWWWLWWCIGAVFAGLVFDPKP